MIKALLLELLFKSFAPEEKAGRPSTRAYLSGLLILLGLGLLGTANYCYFLLHDQEIAVYLVASSLLVLIGFLVQILSYFTRHRKQGQLSSELTKTSNILKTISEKLEQFSLIRNAGYLLVVIKIVGRFLPLAVVACLIYYLSKKKLLGKLLRIL